MSVIPKIPRASGGKAPLGPLPGFYPGPSGDFKRSPDPSPTHAPLTTNPGSAPDNDWIIRVTKQEGLTIVHFLNKLIVSCKEAVRFPF